MSKKDEQKERLAELEAKSRVINDFLVNFGEQKIQVCKEIAALEASIAEEAKPKLRHGDYGLRGHDRFIYTSNSNKYDIAHYADTDTYCSNFTKKEHDASYGGTVILGNTFDDLTALQENVTEFKIRGDKGSIDVRLIGDYIQLTDNYDKQVINIDLIENPDAILGLRQMQATHLRNEAKK